MWAYENVFYQIYPLGFCGAPFENDGVLEHRILKVSDWIRGNLTQIAENLTQSLCDYFGIPLIEPGPIVRGTVVTDGSNLNIRKFPSTEGEIIGTIPNGSAVTVYSRTNGWDVISYQGTVGYACNEYIVL